MDLNSSVGLGTCISFMMPLGKHVTPTPLSGNITAPLVLHRQLSEWGLTCDAATHDNALCADKLGFLPGKLYTLAAQITSGITDTDKAVIPVQPWRLHILLVDDATINLDIIGAMLTLLGQNVTTACNGREALAYGR